MASDMAMVDNPAFTAYGRPLYPPHCTLHTAVSNTLQCQTHCSVKHCKAVLGKCATAVQCVEGAASARKLPINAH